MSKQSIVSTSLDKVESIENTAVSTFNKSIDKFGRQVSGISGNLNPATLKIELNSALKSSGFSKGIEEYVNQAYQGIIDVSGDTYKQLYGKGFKLSDESLNQLGNLQKIDVGNFEALANKTINELNTKLLTSTLTPVSKKILRDSIEKSIDLLKQHMETNVVTSTAGVYRDANTLLAQDNGITKFQYVGSLIATSRKFCKKHLGEIQTMEEWGNEDNGQQLPVPLYQGGYNCRHSFIGIADGFE